jgi:hypothetical protein
MEKIGKKCFLPFNIMVIVIAIMMNIKIMFIIILAFIVKDNIFEEKHKG